MSKLDLRCSVIKVGFHGPTQFVFENDIARLVELQELIQKHCLRSNGTQQVFLSRQLLLRVSLVLLIQVALVLDCLDFLTQIQHRLVNALHSLQLGHVLDFGL